MQNAAAHTELTATQCSECATDTGPFARRCMQLNGMWPVTASTRYTLRKPA